MNDNRHPIDDLFRDGLHDHEEEAPMHVWERIDQARSPLKKFLSNLRGHWKIYAASGVAAAVITCATWLDADFAKAPITSQTEQADKLKQPIENKLPNIESLNDVDNNPPSETRASDLDAPADEEASTQHSSNPLPPNNNEINLHQPAAALPLQNVDNNQALNETDNNSEETSATLNAPLAWAKLQNKNMGLSPAIVAESPVLQNISLAQVQQNEQQKKAIKPFESKWSIGLAYGLGGSNNKMSGNDQLANALAQAEQFGLNQHLELTIAYQLNPLFSLRGGLRATQINSRFNGQYTEWVQTFEQRTVNGVILDPIMGPRNIQYTITDTVYNPVQRNTSAINHYRLIDLPIGLQYTWYKTAKWNLNAGAATILNLSMVATGQTYSPALAIADHQFSQTYKARMGADLSLSLGFGYQLTEQLEWSFEPQYRLGLSNWMAVGTGKQQLNLWNVQSGIRYRF